MMRKWFNQSLRIKLLILFIFVLYLVSSFYLLVQGEEGLIFFLLTSLVAFVGVISGIIPALVLTLAIFFTVGSVIFWFVFVTESFASNFGLFDITIWMAHLLILAIVTGRLSVLIKDLQQENIRLQEQVQVLVAIDPITGFDNRERLLIELELEFNRSERYNHKFTLLFIKINHYDELRKMYGEGELNRILLHLSTGIYRTVRKSDYKFRPEKDLFGLILTETSRTDVEVVIEKLDKELKVFQLMNKKHITLDLLYGYVSNEEEANDHLELYELAMEQVSFHVS